MQQELKGSFFKNSNVSGQEGQMRSFMSDKYSISAAGIGIALSQQSGENLNAGKTFSKANHSTDGADDYNQKIHGHVNGNQNMNSGSNNYFL